MFIKDKNELRKMIFKKIQNKRNLSLRDDLISD